MRRPGEIPSRRLYLRRTRPRGEVLTGRGTERPLHQSRRVTGNSLTWMQGHPQNQHAAKGLHPYGISASGPDLCLCLRLPPQNMSQTKESGKEHQSVATPVSGDWPKNRRQNRLERKERSDRCFTDLLDQLTKHNIAHSLNKLDAPDNKVTASAHPCTRDLVSEFTHHPRNVHHNTT